MATAANTHKVTRNDELEASKVAAIEAYKKMLEAKDHFSQAAGAAGVDLKDEAFKQMESGKLKVKDMEQQLESYVQKKPLTSMGIAFASGFVLSWLVGRK